MKPLSLVIGIAALIVGSLYYKFPDWSIGVSVFMALVAYATAPLAIACLLKGRIVAFAVLAWFGSDGSYVAYSALAGVDVSDLRWLNFGVSLPLFLICGLIWSAIPDIEKCLGLRQHTRRISDRGTAA